MDLASPSYDEHTRTNEPSLVGSDLGNRNSKSRAQSRVLKLVGEGPGLGLGSEKTLNTELGDLGDRIKQ